MTVAVTDIACQAKGVMIQTDVKSIGCFAGYKVGWRMLLDYSYQTSGDGWQMLLAHRLQMLGGKTPDGAGGRRPWNDLGTFLCATKGWDGRKSWTGQFTTSRILF